MGARRKNTFTTFRSDVIDDSKALVDDLIDRAQEFEEKARDAATSALGDDDADSPSADEVATPEAGPQRTDRQGRPACRSQGRREVVLPATAGSKAAAPGRIVPDVTNPLVRRLCRARWCRSPWRRPAVRIRRA